MQQVFDEAITYTALQFFTRRSNECVRVFPTPRGDVDVAKRTWEDPELVVPYESLDPVEPWLLLPRRERELIQRFSLTYRRLDDPSVTRGIIVGVQTSADHIYHLERLGRDRYLCRSRDARGRRQTPHEVDIEEAITRPLVSGPQARRYEQPETDIHILFPYEIVDGRALLIAPERMEGEFPNAWRHLKRHEEELRQRENGAFDDAQWYRFGRNQNIDKQGCPKLIVAQTVPSLRVCTDERGVFCLDNVRVNGILPTTDADMWYLLAVMNCAVADFMFRRISVPKSGGYFEANRQFIAPLPLPTPDKASRAMVGHLAREQQAHVTQRRRILEQLSRRLETSSVRPRMDTWLWPEIGSPDEWETRAPTHFDSHERADWARRQRSSLVESRINAIQARFCPHAVLRAERHGTELVFTINGVPVLERVFVEETEADFILAQWRLIARTFTIGAETKAKRLTDALRRVVIPRDATIVRQVLALDRELETLDARVGQTEAALEDLLSELYGLTGEERRMIAAG